MLKENFIILSRETKFEKFIILLSIVFILFTPIFNFSNQSFLINYANVQVTPIYNPPTLIKNPPSSDNPPTLIKNPSPSSDKGGGGGPFTTVITNFAEGLINPLTDKLKELFCKLINEIIKFFFAVIRAILDIVLRIVAFVADLVWQLNPFSESTEVRAIEILWNVLLNFSYIFFSFLILVAGFKLIIEGYEQVLSFIFNIIIVALLINYSFLLVNIAFSTVYSLEKNLVRSTISGGGPGSLIYESFNWESGRGAVENFGTNYGQKEQVKIEGFSDACNNLLPSFIGGVFSIAFYILMIIIVVIVAFILVARFVMITFLTGISSLALATLMLPSISKLKINPHSFFGWWLGKLVSWLLVFPVLLILVVLGNVLKTTLSSQIAALKGGIDSNFQDITGYVIIFLVLTGWYVISIIVAEVLAGRAAITARSIALGVFATVGMGSTRILSRLGAPIVGGTLQKIGGISERLPVNMLTTPFINLGSRIKDIGGGMKEKAYEGEKKAAQIKLLSLTDKLEKAKDPQQKQAALNQIAGLIDKYKTNPIILQGLQEKIEKSPQSFFEDIAKDPQIAQFFLSPNLPPEFRRMMGDKISNLSKSTLSDMLTDIWLNTIQQAGPEVINGFIQGIEKLDDATLIAKVNQNIKNKQLDIQTLKNLNPKLKATLNKQAKGLFTALEQKNIDAIVAAASQLSSEFYRDFGQFGDLLKQYGFSDTEIRDLERNIIEHNPENVFKGIVETGDRNKYRFIIARLAKMGARTPEEAARILNIQKGSSAWRNLVRIFSATTLGTETGFGRLEEAIKNQKEGASQQSQPPTENPQNQQT